MCRKRSIRRAEAEMAALCLPSRVSLGKNLRRCILNGQANAIDDGSTNPIKQLPFKVSLHRHILRSLFNLYRSVNSKF